MNLNLDKFWEYIRQWSVGRMMVLLVILAWMINAIAKKELQEGFVLTIVCLGVFLEVFELSANHYRYIKEKVPNSKCIICIASMLIAIIGIGLTCYYRVFHV
ncbi:MAG: hypothetical protein WCQ47_03690 [bacterium]